MKKVWNLVSKDKLEELFEKRETFMHLIQEKFPDSYSSWPVDISNKNSQVLLRETALKGVEEMFEALGHLKNWKSHRETDVPEIDREDPTVLDIMTDMRALPGIVTVRQTRPLSDVVTSYGHRLIELNVSYIPSFIEEKDKFMTMIRSLKKVEGVDMIKVMEHDNDIINAKLKKSPLVI